MPYVVELATLVEELFFDTVVVISLDIYNHIWIAIFMCSDNMPRKTIGLNAYGQHDHYG
jgi:hypothetical protein